jgi:hypothetical protein
MREDGARGTWPSDQILIKKGAWKLGFLSIIAENGGSHDPVGRQTC